MKILTESDIEAAILEWLSTLSWTVAHGPDIAPEGKAPEGASYDGVTLLMLFGSTIKPSVLMETWP